MNGTSMRFCHALRFSSSLLSLGFASYHVFCEILLWHRLHFWSATSVRVTILLPFILIVCPPITFISLYSTPQTVESCLKGQFASRSAVKDYR